MSVHVYCLCMYMVVYSTNEKRAGQEPDITTQQMVCMYMKCYTCDNIIARVRLVRAITVRPRLLAGVHGNKR